MESIKKGNIGRETGHVERRNGGDYKEAEMGEREGELK